MIPPSLREQQHEYCIIGETKSGARLFLCDGKRTTRNTIVFCSSRKLARTFLTRKRALQYVWEAVQQTPSRKHTYTFKLWIDDHENLHSGVIEEDCYATVINEAKKTVEEWVKRQAEKEAKKEKKFDEFVESLEQ